MSFSPQAKIDSLETEAADLNKLLVPSLSQNMEIVIRKQIVSINNEKAQWTSKLPQQDWSLIDSGERTKALQMLADIRNFIMSQPM